MYKNSMRGITIIEFITTVAIIAILASFASLGVDFVRKERVASVTRKLLADLQRQRVRAMTREGSGFGIRFATSSAYTLFTFHDCNGDYTYDVDTCEGDREEAAIDLKILPATVVIKDSLAGNAFTDDILIFDRFGTPRSAGWALGWRTVIIEDVTKKWSRCIVVSTNRIREGMGQWSAADGKYACTKY